MCACILLYYNYNIGHIMHVAFTYSNEVTSPASPEESKYTSSGSVVAVIKLLKFIAPSRTKLRDTWCHR